LRKDGLQETNELALQFLQLMKRVSDSCKIEVLELQGQLRKSQHEMSAMQESKGLAEAQLQVALQEIEILKAMTQQKFQAYCAVLGLDDG